MSDNVHLNEIGGRWGVLYSQAMHQAIIQEKRILALEVEIGRLQTLTEDLQAQLQSAPGHSLSPAARAIAARPVKWSNGAEEEKINE